MGIANQRQNVLMTVRASSVHGMSSKKNRPIRPSTARPPDHLLQSCSSSPASSHAISAAPAHAQIIPFNLAPPSLASSHAISAAPASPARPQPVHRPSTRFNSRSISSLLPCYFCNSSPSTCHFCTSSPSTARPPDHPLQYDVPTMWGNIHPQWRLLQQYLETKGPGWYPLTEREERLFTNTGCGRAGGAEIAWEEAWDVWDVVAGILCKGGQKRHTNKLDAGYPESNEDS